MDAARSEAHARSEARAAQPLPPPPLLRGLWLLALLGLGVALIGTAVVARREGYALFPPSPNALFAARAALRALALATLAVWAWLFLPWLWARRRPLPARGLAGAWALLLATAAWARLGYRYNRYDIAPLWKEHATHGGVALPRALLDRGALAHNLLLTLGALALGVLLYGALAPLTARLATSTRRPSSGRRHALVGLGALACLVLGGAWILPPTAVRPRVAGPDLILISLDALRADRLGCYGSTAGLTPHLDAFAAHSVRFARAYSQEPWTLTSHMSMLTGLDPDAHGLDFGRALSPRVWTLAERLRDAGYRTRGCVFDCYLLDPRFGYAAGFDRYEVDRLDAAARCRAAARWLLRDRRPAFLFLHLYDPHSDTGALPYDASPRWRQQIAPAALRDFARWSGEGGASERLRRVNEGSAQLPDSLRAALTALYDAGVAQTDAAVGELLAALQAAGRLDDALVLIVADHGEALGERGQFMHEALMEATLHIPFLLHWPGGEQAGRVRDDLVETLDILPTLLRAAGLQSPDIAQGHDLRATDPTQRRAAFSRSGPTYALSTADGWRMLYEWSATGPRFLSLREPHGDPSDGPELLAAHPERTDPWVDWIFTRHRADALLAARLGGGAVGMTGADEELLRSLGYIR